MGEKTAFIKYLWKDFRKHFSFTLAFIIFSTITFFFTFFHKLKDNYRMTLLFLVIALISSIFTWVYGTYKGGGWKGEYRKEKYGYTPSQLKKKKRLKFHSQEKCEICHKNEWNGKIIENNPGSGEILKLKACDKCYKEREEGEFEL